MNGRQLAFCASYVKCRNAEQAMIDAGYSPHTIRSNAYKFLQNPAIQEQINFLTNMQREQMVLDANLVINELGAIAFTRPHELIELRDGKWVKKRPEDIPDRVQAAIKKISVRTMKDGSQEFSYELYDKMPALYKLGEHLGVGEAGHRDTGGNPFEDMDQEELDAIQTTMQKALDRRALIGEVEDA